MSKVTKSVKANAKNAKAAKPAKALAIVAPIAGKDAFGYSTGTRAAAIMASLSKDAAKPLAEICADVEKATGKPLSKGSARAHFAHTTGETPLGIARNFVESAGRGLFKLTGRTIADVKKEEAKAATKKA